MGEASAADEAVAAVPASSSGSVVSASQHAAAWPSPIWMSGGSSTHFSKASGQRVRKRQPVGIAEASGVSPTRIVRLARSPGAGGSGEGATETRAAV